MKKLNRRSFVQRSLAGTAAAAVLPGMAMAETTTPPVAAREPLKISIMNYSFRGLRSQGMMDVFGYLESSRYRYHLNGADFWHAFVEDKEDEEYLKKIRAALDERGLELANIAVDGPLVWRNEADRREQDYHAVLVHLNAARILQPRFVRIDAGGSEAEWTSEQFDFIVTRYKEYAQYAYDHGFKAGAENHGGLAARRWSNLKRLYDAVDHPGFGLCNHLGSWDGTDEDKRAGDRDSAPFIDHTHLDFNLCTGPNLEERLGYLWNAGYEGYYSVEHHSAQNEYANVAIQLAHVRRVLEGFQQTELAASR